MQVAVLISQYYVRAATARRPSTLKINTFLALTGRPGAASSSAQTLSLLYRLPERRLEAVKGGLHLKHVMQEQVECV